MGEGDVGLLCDTSAGSAGSHPTQIYSDSRFRSRAPSSAPVDVVSADKGLESCTPLGPSVVM